MHLRHVALEDLPALYEQQRDPESIAMAHFPARELDAFLAHWRTNVLGNPANIARTIDVGGAVAGYVASWQPAEGPREVGYWLARAHWGRGVATAALAAFLAEHEARRPLVACIARHNEGSRRVLEKNGFVPFGAPAAAPDGVVELTFRLDR